LEIKQHMQNSKLSEMAAVKGESAITRRSKNIDKGLLVNFGDLMFAQLEAIPIPNVDKSKAFSLDKRIKEEGTEDHQDLIAADLCQQETLPEIKNSVDLTFFPSIKLHKPNKIDAINIDNIVDIVNMVNTENTVNIANSVDAIDAINEISDKALDLTPLQEMDKEIPQETSHVLKGNNDVGLSDQRVVQTTETLPEQNELERKPAVVEKDAAAGNNLESKLIVDKKQIGDPVNRIQGQEENPKNSGENLIKEVNQVIAVNRIKGNNTVSAVNQVNEKGLLLNTLEDMDRVEVPKNNINKEIFQETPRVQKENNTVEGTVTKANHLTEEANNTNQRVIRVINETENLPPKKENGTSLAPLPNKNIMSAVEEDVAVGKNIENQLKIQKQQVKYSVVQTKDQGEKPANNGVNLIKEVNQVSAVNEANEANPIGKVNQKGQIGPVKVLDGISDKAVDLSSLKDMDSIEVKKTTINTVIYQETSHPTHLTEKESLLSQGVVNEEENLPKKKEIKNKMGAAEKDGPIGKKLENNLGIEKEQTRYSVVQMKDQEENPIKNRINLVKEVNQVVVINEVNQVAPVKQKKEINRTNGVNQISDKALDLSPIEEVDNVKTFPVFKAKAVPGGAEVEVDQRMEVSFPYRRVVHEEGYLPEKQEFRPVTTGEEDTVIVKNMDNQVIEKHVINDSAVQLKGREESANLGIKIGLDKLPLQVGDLFERVSLEKKPHSWELRLEPEKLGKLKIIVNWDQGKIKAEFLVETGQTAKALESYLDNLKQNLGQKNIDVASLSITVAGQSSGGGFQGMPQPFSRREKGFVPKGNEFSLPVQEEGENIVEGKSVNYLV